MLKALLALLVHIVDTQSVEPHAHDPRRTIN